MKAVKALSTASAISALLLLLLFSSGCVDGSSQGLAPLPENQELSEIDALKESANALPKISAFDLRERIRNGSAPVLLDIRSREQFDSNHIDGAVNILFRDVKERHSEINAEKDSEIVLIFYSPLDAGIALSGLEGLGYTSITSLDGGNLAYKSMLDKEMALASGKVYVPIPDANFFDSPLIAELYNSLIPRGTPEYGNDLISFDNPDAALTVFYHFDGGMAKEMVDETTITLEGAELEKYNAALPRMFCEFCCGPVTIDRCGCNHAAAYRGLVKYLIKNYPSYSVDELVEEQVRWKGLWFQRSTILKALRERNAEGLLIDSDLNKLVKMIGGC